MYRLLLLALLLASPGEGYNDDRPARMTQAEYWLRRAEGAWQADSNHSELGEIRTVRAFLNWQQGDVAHAAHFAREALVLLPEGESQWRGRLLLIGVGMGLFNGPNQALLMSVGRLETVSAASALANLSSRLGSVFGPLLLSLLWSALPGLALQMNGGSIVLAFLAVLCVFCAWMAKPQAQQGQQQDDAAPIEQQVAE